ncbi:hypothetical protein HHK36_024273 [Tetracentron sinense]|uniref:Flavin-containing monooxygenase n=1 Tax=Tetracentron sinense TaxID=13715 RepID=A0A834YJ53_TETSI|nr:hypothetical protein HHK36_024273 [Tetracentron sinense]
MVSKQVCVIGAGPLGLVAARELRKEGHSVVVLEQNHDVGGQWLYEPRVGCEDSEKGATPEVHSSIYASLRLTSPREIMGITDFPFLVKEGRDMRRFPGQRELLLYLEDFCEWFGLKEMIRFNTWVEYVGMVDVPKFGNDMKWVVRSKERRTDNVMEEVFDAVVVATGHYSQPRLPSIKGMDTWRRKQIHSHIYRVPEPFRDEIVVVIGNSLSGTDISMELVDIAKEIHLSAKSLEISEGLSKVISKHDCLHIHPQIDSLCEDGWVLFIDGSWMWWLNFQMISPSQMVGLNTRLLSLQVVVVIGNSLSGQDISMELVDVAKEIHLSAKSLEISEGLSKVISKHDNLHIHPQIDSLREDGQVLFIDGSWIFAETIIYCTGYSYSFPFLDTKGIVEVDDDRVGPLYEHTLPPSLAPSLSFMGIPTKIIPFPFFESQAKWIAQLLSEKKTLPSCEDMMQSIREFYHSRDVAGIPKHKTHEIANFEYCDMFGDHIGFPHLEEWRKELSLSTVRNANTNLETYRDSWDDLELLEVAHQSPHFTQLGPEAFSL